MSPSISVFVPMYNEETNAGILLPILEKILNELTEDYEIVVVDDASCDRTVPLVEDYAARDPRIRLLRHEKNLGYGMALRTGYLNVQKDIVFYTDADVPIDFAVLKDVIPLLKDHPVVLGYRLDRRDSVKRWVFSKIYNLILRTFFDLRVRDVNFSFKIMRKEVVDQFKDRLTSESVFIDGEILVHIHRQGIPFHEIPIEYRPRKHGLSTLGTWRQALWTFREIWRFYRRSEF